MRLYPDFSTAVAQLQCHLACYSHPREIVWFFAEDIVAHGGHAFFAWPAQDNSELIQGRYEQARAKEGYVSLGYYCTVGERSACYLSTTWRNSGEETAGFWLSMQANPDKGHRVPRLLWPLVSRLFRCVSPDPSISYLVPAHRQEAYSRARH